MTKRREFTDDELFEQDFDPNRQVKRSKEYLDHQRKMIEWLKQPGDAPQPKPESKPKPKE